MTPISERAGLVALLRGGSRPWPHYADEVEEAGSALEVLRAESSDVVGEPAGQTSLFDPAPATAPDLDQLLAAASVEIEAWTGEGLTVLTVIDDGYPERLRAVHDRPPLIFVAGALIEADNQAIAVVGSRNASTAGRRAAAEIAEHLVTQGYTVVSGLAAGIDTAAHTAALAGGRTIAVIGTGLGHAYPPQNAGLQRRIAAQGAVVSQFWPERPPSRRSFPMRNATMSGLSLATVIVEASRTSGARIQARQALGHGRPVFLAERVLSQAWAQALARRPGVTTFAAPEEISDAVGRIFAPSALCR